MPSIIDYLDHQFASFDDLPFNVVDAAVLSQVCMVRGKGVIPPLKERQAFANMFTVLRNVLSANQRPIHFIELLKAEHFADMFGGLDPERTRRCLFAVAASPRFRQMKVRDYLSLFDTRLEMQFAAMTFVHKDQFAVVTFRGTDASITGWKEDFNMAYASPVPAQEQALRYLEAVAPRLPHRLILNGHSKGGNLAEYAALKAPAAIRNRLEAVYNLDGPGFKEGMFTEDDYEPVIDRIVKIVPEDAVIGALLHSPVKPRAVASKARGFNQHNVFNWEVEVREQSETGLVLAADARDENAREKRAESDLVDYATLIGNDFVTVSGPSGSAAFAIEAFNRWVTGYDDHERATIIDALFRALESTGADDVLDLLSGGTRTMNLFREAARNMDGDDRDLIMQAGRSFAETTSQFATERMGQAAAQSVMSGAAKLAQAIEGAAARRTAREATERP